MSVMTQTQLILRVLKLDTDCGDGNIFLSDGEVITQLIATMEISDASRVPESLREVKVLKKLFIC